MDLLPDWAAHFLANHNEDLRAYTPYLRHLYTYTSTLRSHLLPLISSISSKPDLATIALLLIILFISLKLLNMLWQTLLFWINLARRVVFYGGLVGLGLWMYTRGAEGVQEDVGYWVGVWRQERDYWRERERAARLGNQWRMRGDGGRGGGWF